MNKKNTYFEFALIFCTFFSLGIQLILGETHILSQLCNRTIIAGFLFYAGRLIIQAESSSILLLKKSGLYYFIFLVLGTLKHVIIYQDNLFWILARMIAGVKIPGLTEIFFTAAVIFLCSTFIKKYKVSAPASNKLFLTISILGICAAFIPSNIFGTPCIGVFLNCNTYNCIPLLPYIGFLFFGMLTEKKALFCQKKLLVISAILCVISLYLISTPLRPIGLVTFATFPVYVLHLFAEHCKIYQELFSHFFNLLTSIFKKCCTLFTFSSSKTKRNYTKYFIVYTIVFFVTAFLVFYSFIDREKSIIWMHDAIAQYVPRVHHFISYMHDAIAQILQGDFNIPMYDFSIGFGNAVSFSFEPIYWLYTLFNSSNVEFAYNFILVFRFFVAGISMSILLLYFKKGFYETLFGSIIYTFCGFAIYAGVLHGHFISPIIMLPLLIIATEELYRKKRWYLCTIFVALALLSSYYFLYMSSLAMGIYYLVRFALTKDKKIRNFKYFISSACMFAFSYILGVLIGNFPLFTSFTSYVSSSRSGSSVISTPTLFYYGENWLLKCFLTFISVPDSPGKWLKLGFVPFAYIAIIVLFMRKGQKTLKSFFIILGSFCLFPIIGFIFSGFSTVTNRWCYILALLVAFICAHVFPHLKTLTVQELKILFISLLPYAAIIIVFREYRTTSNLIALVILLANYICIFFMNNKIRFISIKTGKIALLFLCISSLCLNGFYPYTDGSLTQPKNFPDKGTAVANIKDTPLAVFENAPKDTFYRVATPEVPLKILSSSLVMDYNGITMFSSTIDGPIVDYNSELGNTTWNLVQIAGLDNRTFLNELACVKYYSVTEEQKPLIPYGYSEIGVKNTNEQTYYVYENQYALPFGYTYSNAIDTKDFSQYSTSEKQEVLLRTAVVEDTKTLNELTAKKPETTVENIAITDYELDGVEISDGTLTAIQPNATATLYFDGLTDSETMIEFVGQIADQNETLSISITCGEITKDFKFRSQDHTYYTGQDSYIFNLGYRKEAAQSCTITFHTAGSLSLDSFKISCQPMKEYASNVRKLTEDTLENVNFEANKITGNISLKESKLLVLSMPYQKGWIAYVDGEETELIKTNLMYTGILLETGEHEIELHYERPGLTLAFKLSATGIIIFVIALIIRRKRIRMKLINKNQE